MAKQRLENKLVQIMNLLYTIICVNPW